MPALVASRVLVCAAVLVGLVASGGCGPDDGPRSAVYPDPAAAELAGAVLDGDPGTVRSQVGSGADPDARGVRQLPVLQFAMLHHRRRAFEALLDAGADPRLGDVDGRTAVELAATAQSTYWLSALLARGVSPDAANTVTGEPALSAAVSARRGQSVDLLLAAGADPDHTDRQERTPLHQAALVDDVTVVLTLLEAGADPAARDRTGATFQSYLYGADADPRNRMSKARLDDVRTFLRTHHVEVER